MRRARCMRSERIKLKNCEPSNSASCRKALRAGSRTWSLLTASPSWGRENERKAFEKRKAESGRRKVEMTPMRVLSRCLLALSTIVGASLAPLSAQEGTEPASRQVELKKGDRIIFFGDSLTALAVKDPHV